MLKRIAKKAESAFFFLYLPVAGMAILLMALSALGKETSQNKAPGEDP